MKEFKDYVCTLEQAKKLQELGISQQSLFYYVKNEDYDRLSEDDIYHVHVKFEDDGFCLIEGEDWMHEIHNWEHYAAFTSQELGEIVNKMLVTWSQDNGKFVKYQFYFEPAINDMNYHYIYNDFNNEKESNYIMPEAQARAEFLIYLLENLEK